MINYREETLRDRVKEITGGKGADVVFDPVGGDAFAQAVRCIAWEGRILVIGFASGDIPKVANNMILVKNFSVVGVVFGEHSWRYPAETRERLKELLPFVSSGQLNPRVQKAYPVEEAKTALTKIQDRSVIGKLVLTL